MPEPIQIIHPEVVTCDCATDKGLCLCRSCALSAYHLKCAPCHKSRRNAVTDLDSNCDSNCEITQCNKYSNHENDYENDNKEKLRDNSM